MGGELLGTCAVSTPLNFPMKLKPHLLIVDDDQCILFIIEQTLIGEGYQVSTAENGEDALELAGNTKFQLILIDLVMPGQGGFETIKALHDCQPDARLVAMTGGWEGRSESFLRMAERIGARRTLAKPFSAKELLDAIEGEIGVPGDVGE